MTGYQSKKRVTQGKLEDDDDTQVYTKPWVGLTDDDYQQILKQHNGAGLLAFYNLVEAKLKEKNT